MSYFGQLAKFFGIITVKEQNNLIKVSGIDGLVMAQHIARIWETKALNKYMFTSITTTSFSFNSFFLPDIVYLLSQLHADPNTKWIGKRSIDRILRQVMTHTWFKRTTQEHDPLIDLNRMTLLKWKPLPKQVEFLHIYGDKIPRYDLRGYILAFGPGLGKAQPLDSLVLTPEGFIPFSKIDLSTKIITPSGKIVSILSIHPQGVKDIYKITLEDCRQTECCLDHIWKVFNNNDFELLSLEQILKNYENIRIPVADPQKGYFLQKIKSIDYVGKKEALCIAINDEDQLYITNDYIVTHNTFTDLLLATCVIPPSIAEVKIIISPKKAINLVWEKSIKEVFNKRPTYWVSNSGLKMPLDKTEYYIFNYEQLDNALDLAKNLVSRNIRYFVIVDESHNFADYKSGRTQKLVELQTLKDNIYFVWTSGTPILKNASELISFLKCADKRFDSDAEQRFKRIYSSSPGRANEIFNHRLGNMIAFLVPKSEVITSKPTVKELPVKLPPALAQRYLMSTVRQEMKDYIKERIEFHQAHLSEYKHTINKWLDYHETKLQSRLEKRMFHDYQKNLKILIRTPDLILKEVQDKVRQYERRILLPSLPPTERRNFKNALSAVKNIKLKVRGEALGKVLGKRRSECAAALAKYCQPDLIMKESLSKTLFFASSVLPIKILHDHLKEMGFDPVLVYGATNKNLTDNIDRFTRDPNVNPVCATMQSLSEAVPVTAASTIVLLNRPFRQAHWEQVVSRADRLGQQHPVTIIEVTLDTGDEPNVSSTTDAILANVRELINEIVGEGFAGPDPEERVYLEAIDASQESTIAFDDLEKLEL